MALPNEIQVGRYSALLHKLLDMKEGAPAPTLAPDVFSMLALEVDRPEWKFLMGERLAMGSQSVGAGGAGTYCSVGLYNPADSGVIVILEKVWNTIGTTRRCNIRLGTGSTGLTLVGAGRGLFDTRFGLHLPTAQMSKEATATPAGTIIAGQYTFNNVGYSWDIPVVLAPDSFISFQDTTANQAAYLNIFWRERPLNPSESR